ncbi:MAG: hypothetical protein QJQ54_00585 [Mollicutes bacterium]|nr:MAG: hypothetical protein QJQ54_00585 [Mollicutes bacterium]
MQKDQIRLTPHLITTETKTQAQREVRGYAEEAKVGFRQLRHDLLKF